MDIDLNIAVVCFEMQNIATLDFDVIEFGMPYFYNHELRDLMAVHRGISPSLLSHRIAEHCSMDVEIFNLPLNDFISARSMIKLKYLLNCFGFYSDPAQLANFQVSLLQYEQVHNGLSLACDEFFTQQANSSPSVKLVSDAINILAAQYTINYQLISGLDLTTPEIQEFLDHFHRRTVTHYEQAMARVTSPDARLFTRQLLDFQCEPRSLRLFELLRVWKKCSTKVDDLISVRSIQIRTLVSAFKRLELQRYRQNPANYVMGRPTFKHFIYNPWK
jgi:hypothetical protein